MASPKSKFQVTGAAFSWQYDSQKFRHFIHYLLKQNSYNNIQTSLNIYCVVCVYRKMFVRANFSSNKYLWNFF